MSLYPAMYNTVATNTADARAWVSALAHQGNKSAGWDALVIVDEYLALKTLQPCGHEAQYIYPPHGGDGITRFCVLCELQHIYEVVREAKNKV